MIHKITSYKAIGILILGIIVLSVLHKNNFFYDQPTIVAKKVLATFLKQPADDIFCKALKTGSEATIIQCTHSGTNYIVKLFSSFESGKNEIAWTQHASNLGIGPQLYYADPINNFMITEFAQGRSLVPAIANTPAIIKNCATVIAQLHNSNAPFAFKSDMFTRIAEKYKKLQCSGPLQQLLEMSLQHVQKIGVQIKSFAVPSMPCHNDLNPGNIFVHNDQITVIDWGDSALGNPYYDIAAFFILNVIEPENEKLFWQHYDEKLLGSQLFTYMQWCKNVVYFEFALNLLLGVQAEKQELLKLPQIKSVNRLNYYLTLLAEKEVTIDTDFLYTMAVASLRQMELIQ